MSPKSNSFRERHCTSKFLKIPKYILWILLFIAIVVIVVPIGVMFGRKKHGLKTMVLVPLYVYPAHQAWDPLFHAIESHPHTQFTIITNPLSGPGPNPLPDANFTSQIPRLNHYHNVVNVGYVSTNYSNRAIDDVLGDIGTYAKWSEKGLGLGLKGIFLDETPREWSVEAGGFYEKIAGSIRSMGGLGGRRSLIIHNPGTIPSPLYLPYADLSVIFEGTYDTFKTTNFKQNITSFRNSTRTPREKLACVVHSLPSNLTETERGTFLRELRKLAGSVFVTGLDVDYYSYFWDGFEKWVGQLVK